MAVTVSAAAAAQAPPARARKPKDAATPPPVTAEARQAALIELAAVPVAACIATGRLADAGTIEVYWPSFSREIAKLADVEPAIAKFIDPLTRIGKYSGLLSVALPMAMQFAVNHGRVAAGAMGTTSPAMLAAQIELRIARAEAEALKEQLSAQREARETRAEIEKARGEMAAA